MPWEVGTGRTLSTGTEKNKERAREEIVLRLEVEYNRVG